MIRLFLALSLILTLTACDSSEERAEEHYQNALSLLADGDSPRALIELRNVLKLKNTHLEARRLYADTVIAAGEVAEGLAQYMRLVEQQPEDGAAQLVTARLLMESFSYEEAEPYASNAATLLPDTPEARAIDAAVDYQLALRAKDAQTQQSAITRADQILQDHPDQFYAAQTVMAGLIEGGHWSRLLDQANATLEFHSKSLPIHRARLMALERLGDLRGMEDALLQMAENFPEDPSLGVKLVNWYTRQGRLADAERWLREQTATEPEARELLIAYIKETRGPEAALTDLNQSLSSEPEAFDIAAHRARFQALRAALRYELGETDQATLELKALLKDAPESEATDRTRIALAAILSETGQHSAAQKLVTQVLNHDPAQVDALRMQGDWLIDEDKTGNAIITLRKALDQEPDNALVLATLARAYEREGSQDLMSDVLMRAVESASYDPALTLKMVEVLRTQGQLPAAENLTLEALRRQNTNLQLLGTLTEIHIAMEDWGRVTQDIHRLRQLRSDAAAHLADQLEGQQLIQRRKTKELMQFVENQLDNDTTGAAMVIRSMILDNQMAEAANYAKAAYTAQPEDPVASFLYATTLGHIHQDAEAIALFRSLVTDDPTLRDAWMAMYNLHQRAGEMKTALSVIEEALDHLPQDAGLKWIHASHMQAIGETDQAIAIYEDLYAQDSGQEIIANNLASLLSTERDDTDSLNRAYLIARRLQGSTYPPYQDTYGWIALKRGEVAQALEHLEPAASALNGDPTVQYHLGMAYVAAGQAQSAQTTLVYASELLMDHQDEMPELQAQVTAALASLAAAPSEIVTE